MEFSVPTNWDDSLIEKLRGLPIREFFGKLSTDFFGGGRPSIYIPRIKNKRLRQHIELIHKCGYKFNYLLNSSCLDNIEFTRNGQYRMHKFLDWLMENKVDAVTVSIPYLVHWIRRNYPTMEIKVSVIADIDALSKAQQWESWGVDSAVLSLDCNRDFSLLSAIVENIKCDISLIVNLACLRFCPLSQYHYVLGSHASQSQHNVKHFFVDYCMFFCTWLRFTDLSQIIRSGWIRPEDIGHYEELGIYSFKIVGRELPTDKIVKIITAYTNRYYDGNLLNLFAPFAGESEFTLDKFIRGLEYVIRPSKIRLSFIKKIFKLSKKKPIFIDNRALDNFWDSLKDKNCRIMDCQKCQHCQKISEKVIHIDEGFRKEMQQAYREILDELESGNAFKFGI